MKKNRKKSISEDEDSMLVTPDMLADYYTNGRGIPMTRQEALEWLKEYAEFDAEHDLWKITLEGIKKSKEISK